LPRLPRLPARRIARALERGGFELDRQRGSHLVYVNRQTERVAVVPVHGGRDVPVGTLKGILSQAALTTEQFLELL